jgi:hypothetical protein
MIIIAGDGYLNITPGEQPNTVDIGMYLVRNVSGEQLHALAHNLALKAAEMTGITFSNHTQIELDKLRREVVELETQLNNIGRFGL